MNDVVSGDSLASVERRSTLSMLENEITGDSVLFCGSKRFSHHHRAHIRPAHTDIDDIGDDLSACTGPSTTMD